MTICLITLSALAGYPLARIVCNALRGLGVQL